MISLYSRFCFCSFPPALLDTQSLLFAQFSVGKEQGALATPHTDTPQRQQKQQTAIRPCKVPCRLFLFEARIPARFGKALPVGKGAEQKGKDAPKAARFYPYLFTPLSKLMYLRSSYWESHKSINFQIY